MMVILTEEEYHALKIAPRAAAAKDLADALNAFTGALTKQLTTARVPYDPFIRDGQFRAWLHDFLAPAFAAAKLPPLEKCAG